MTNPKVIIHNAETGEIVEREMNEIELEDYNNNRKVFEAREEEVRAKATAKADLLEKLGITAEEAALLLS